LRLIRSRGDLARSGFAIWYFEVGRGVRKVVHI
jgi:hypothetical protein